MLISSTLPYLVGNRGIENSKKHLFFKMLFILETIFIVIVALNTINTSSYSSEKDNFIKKIEINKNYSDYSFEYNDIYENSIKRYSDLKAN